VWETHTSVFDFKSQLSRNVVGHKLHAGYQLAKIYLYGLMLSLKIMKIGKTIYFVFQKPNFTQNVSRFVFTKLFELELKMRKIREIDFLAKQFSDC